MENSAKSIVQKTKKTRVFCELDDSIFSNLCTLSSALCPASVIANAGKRKNCSATGTTEKPKKLVIRIDIKPDNNAMLKRLISDCSDWPNWDLEFGICLEMADKSF